MTTIYLTYAQNFITASFKKTIYYNVIPSNISQVKCLLIYLQSRRFLRYSESTDMVELSRLVYLASLVLFRARRTRSGSLPAASSTWSTSRTNPRSPFPSTSSRPPRASTTSSSRCAASAALRTRKMASYRGSPGSWTMRCIHSLPHR